MRRVGAASTETAVRDTVHWYGMKARLQNAPAEYPRWTTMSVQIRSGGKLAARSENQINVVATRILPTLQPDGSWGPAEPTRDISAFVKYITSTIGYDDSRLDMDELARMHALWTQRGETLDHVFDLMVVKEALSVALGAGMAELTVTAGQIRPVRDMPRTTFETEQGYSPQNILGDLVRNVKLHEQDDNDGVEAQYTDGRTWKTETVICALPGSQRLKLKTETIRGVTDRTRVWRIGMRIAAIQRYRRTSYRFETELEALNSRYMSYVPLIDDLPGYGQSAILESIERVGADAVLRVSEPFEWEDGTNHVVAYRRPDGTVAGPWPATRLGDYRLSAAIPDPLPIVTLRHEPPHVYFGTTERWCWPALITNIDPRGMDSASVSAVNYDERVYLYDDDAPED